MKLEAPKTQISLGRTVITANAILSPRPHPVFLLPVVALMFAVIEALRLRPESPIVLFATIAPWRPALISITAAVTEAIFIYASRLNPNDRNA